jgi:Rrf2 family protein
MLTIGSKSKYGILAVLSLARNHEQGLLQIKDISSQNTIPNQYLGQIFNLLVKADIITSVRGKNGGYKLSRPPSDISILEIIELLEGGIEFVEKQGSSLSDDAVNDLFHQAESQLRKVFNISLEDLLSLQQNKKQILMFDI